MGVFSLTGWSRLIQTGFLVSRPTQDTAIVKLTYLYGSFTLYGRTFQIVPVHCLLNIAVLLPRHCRNNTGLGYFPFARRYLGNRCFFLFLLLLRCFSSEGWPPSPESPDQVSFANPRSLSQLTTSFVASKSLGIPHAPFITFLQLLHIFIRKNHISSP